MSTITYTVCPACGSASISKRLAAKDYTVSGETFDIFECTNCSMRFTQNVPDSTAIGTYYKASSYISHTDTREGLINRVYHGVRNFTLARKNKLIQEILNLKSGKLLDIGAGTGAFVKYMQTEGWEVTGLEPDAETRERALTINKQRLLSADSLFQLPQHTFQAITLWHVLEHVHTLHEYVSQIKTLLSPGGAAFIAVPNYTSADAQHYDKYWAAYDVPRHLYHFSPASMQALVNKHGMKVKTIRPMWFDSFYVSMLSEQHKHGSPRNASAFLSGLRSNVTAYQNKERCSSLIYVIA